MPLPRYSLDRFRQRLAGVDALPQLAFLAVVAGAVTGAVILAFRMGVDLALLYLLPGDDSENFEALSWVWRAVLPLAGAVALAALLQPMRASHQRTGVSHVMERLTLHQGHLPARNAVTQFVGGTLALVAGLSGGREGPAIHLGAATSSLLGQWARLPNNSIRTLVGCGTAAAIAGSFNTPLAGVIFTMEVVMLEYTIGSFIPVILAAVVATFMTRLVYGSDASFIVPALDMNSLWELPVVIVAGVLIGALAAVFSWLVEQFSRLGRRPAWQRCLLAGAVTAVAAVISPGVMGVGYDSVNAAMLDELAWTVLAILAVAKIVASAACVGLSMPVGVIGPTFVIGAAVGGVIGHAGAQLVPDGADAGFYVMLGMAAMMAAVLQAPLAALLAVLELTANPYVILPAMLVIVTATLTASEVFGRGPVFASVLRRLGLEYPPSAVFLHLQRVGVASVMQREFVRLDAELTADAARAALTKQPKWVVVESATREATAVLNAQDLGRFIDERFADQGDATVDLMRVPGMRKDVASINYQATLAEARAQLERTGVEALCVRRITAPLIAPIVGVITRDDIEAYMRFSS